MKKLNRTKVINYNKNNKNCKDFYKIKKSNNKKNKNRDINKNKNNY